MEMGEDAGQVGKSEGQPDAGDDLEAGTEAPKTPPGRGFRGSTPWIFVTFLYQNRPVGNARTALSSQEFPLKVIIYSVLFLLFPLISRAENAERVPSDVHADLAPVYGLYRDVTQDQSDLAHKALDQAYSANVKAARKSLSALRRLEEGKSLPPLSYLLSVAVDVMRYQNGDFADAEEERALLLSIQEAAEQGRYLCEEFLQKQENHPTYLLILGGIRGFLATLKIQPDPGEAMGDGFQALKLLEKSREKDSRVKDSYMGTGIFHSTAANAPLVVRATLKIIGRSVNMKQGLEALRVSAYEGQYTSVASQLFLIQFLSPYVEELKREKRQIFLSLEEAYPRNPFYTFLKTNEALCFYPDSFYRPETRLELEQRILAFKPLDLASRRYAELVKRQYQLLNPGTGDEDLTPDSSFVFRDYKFYPVFLQAVRYKRNAQDSLASEKTPPSEVAKVLKGLRSQCLDLIAESPMNSSRRRLYAWHVTDALRWKRRQDRIPEGELESVTEIKQPARERRGK